MDTVLTLVSADNNILKHDQIDRLSAALSDKGAVVAPPSWLAQDKACDLSFQNLAPDAANQIARAMLGTASLDMLVQAQKNRRKKIFVADMDSTIVAGETLDDLAEFAGIGPQIAEITARAMNGEILFRDALRERMAMLRGLPISYLEKTANALVFNPGAETLIRTLKANGVYTALVSGGFQFFTKRVADYLGFDFNKGNQIEIINERFTGEVIDPIVTKAVKSETLEMLAKERGLDLFETMTVGDGANDLPMLQAAGLGVAYYAKPVVVAGARAQIAHTDLTTLLYYQGYTQSEFVN